MVQSFVRLVCYVVFSVCIILIPKNITVKSAENYL